MIRRQRDRVTPVNGAPSYTYIGRSVPKGNIKMLDAEQAVRTSESSGYKTQALVKFMIAFCGAFSLTFGIWALGLASSRSAAGNSPVTMWTMC